MSQSTNFLNSTLPDFPEDENGSEYQYLEQKYDQDHSSSNQDAQNPINTLFSNKTTNVEDNFSDTQNTIPESKEDNLEDLNAKVETLKLLMSDNQNSSFDLTKEDDVDRSSVLPWNSKVDDLQSPTDTISSNLPLVHKIDSQEVASQKDYLPTLNSTWLPSKKTINTIPPSVPVQAPKKKNGIFGKVFLILFLLVSIFLVVIFTPAAIAGIRIAFAAQDIKINFDQIEVDFKKAHFSNAKQNVKSIEDDLVTIQDSLQNIGLIDQLPVLDSRIIALKDMIRASEQTVRTVDELMDILVDLEGALSGQNTVNQSLDLTDVNTYSNLSIQQKRNILHVIYNSLPRLRLARDKIEIATTLWESIDQDILPKTIQGPLAKFIMYFPKLKHSLDQTIPMIEVFIPLLGYPDTQYYLVLNQNADELRPTGGFIGTVIDMKIDNGDFNKYKFIDVYNIDDPVEDQWNVKPPLPITKFFGLPKLFMRDANWSPDFGVATERVMSYYEQEKALNNQPVIPRTTGVALEPSFFKNLLGYTGPFTVDGYDLDKDNFMDILQYNVEIKPWESVEKRKEFMGDVGDALFEKIKSMPKKRWPELLDVITKALDEKQILIYSRDPELEEKLNQRNWAGKVKNTKGDYVFIVDANLGARKTDRVMERVINYEVDARDVNSPVATITLNYHNTANEITWRHIHHSR